MTNDINKKTNDARRQHYEVEKELAAKLMRAPREERPEIYRTMYQELLERIPEHSRLAESVSMKEMEAGLKRQRRLVKKYLGKNVDLLEFAPGTCRFSYMIAESVRSVTAVDISDQRLVNNIDKPDNFIHVIYDGYTLALPDDSVDLVFSNQFIEHIHPEDVFLHFRLANRLLRSSGRYVFSTPHLFVGPGDVSRGFSEVAEGFHLKEWTCRELDKVLHEAGFTKTMIMIWVKGNPIVVPLKSLYFLLENIFEKFEIKLRRRLSRYLFTQVLFVAEK